MNSPKLKLEDTITYTKEMDDAGAAHIFGRSFPNLINKKIKLRRIYYCGGGGYEFYECNNIFLHEFIDPFLITSK